MRSWDQQNGLGAVVPAMLSGGLSGWPYWGPDIAGFADAAQTADQASVGQRAQQPEGEKELWMRWVQLGALSPTMRDMYGMQHDPVDLWTDDQTLAVFRGYARLHSALKPYLYRYAQIAHQRGLPILRPLFLNYPTDTTTFDLADEYLIGDEVLVAPVLEPQQVTRRLYLPAERWRDYWTGTVYQGPGWVVVAAPMQRVPLFVRADAAIVLPKPDELDLPGDSQLTYSTDR
ncbi:MAG: TIM-barrel domain-containing protein [Roseiflexaceae bacterium]